MSDTRRPKLFYGAWVLLCVLPLLAAPPALPPTIFLFQNPNYVSAKLNGIVMTMFHEDLAGEEAPFGVVTFSGEDVAKLPARGSAVVRAEVW